MGKDWIGTDKKGHITMIGGANYIQHERQFLDYYATEPKAVRLLLELEKFDGPIWVCACGEGHLSLEMESLGYEVFSSDIICRSYDCYEIDFLNYDKKTNMNIITNPPYAYAKEFILKSLEIMEEGKKLALFLPTRYLESKGRRKIYDENPPYKVYVSSGRIVCAINGDFEKATYSAVSYCWIVWKKGYTGETKLKWFN